MICSFPKFTNRGRSKTFVPETQFSIVGATVTITPRDPVSLIDTLGYMKGR